MPQNQIIGDDVYTISWDNYTRSRNPTQSANLIITRYVLVSSKEGVIQSKHIKGMQISSSNFHGVLVLPEGYQGESSRTCIIQSGVKLEKTCIRMEVASRAKGNFVMVRSIEDIVFSTEMIALDFEPNREE